MEVDKDVVDELTRKEEALSIHFCIAIALCSVARHNVPVPNKAARLR